MKKLFILLLFALFHALLAQGRTELEVGVEQVGDVSRFRFNYYYFDVANISWNPNADHVMFMLSQVSGESNLFVSLQDYPQNRSCPHCVKRTGPGMHYVTVDRVDWGNKERFYIGVEGFDFRARYKLTMWVTGMEDSHIILQDGETKAAYTKDGDHYTYFKFELKEVTPFLKITLSPRGESDDPDLFVSTKTKLPTSTDYEWKQTGWGPDWLELPNAQPAIYYIGVKAFLTDAYFTIACETDRSHVLLLEGIPIAAQVSGTAGNTADEFYKFYVSEKQSIGGRPDVHVSVDGAGDPKVYIYQSRTKVYPSPRLYHYKREQGTDQIVIPNAVSGWYWVAVRDVVGNRYRISQSGEWAHVDLAPGHQLTDQYVDEDSARFFRFYNLDDENGITFSVNAEPSYNADVEVWMGDMRRPHKDSPGAIKFTKQLDSHFIHIPPLTRIGDYFIGVWSYGGDAFFSISAYVNHTVMELYDGEVSYGHHVPKDAYRYFWFDTRSHTKKLDFLISTKGFGDLILYSAQHPNTQPTSEKYTWRSSYQPYSANEHIYISSSDPLRSSEPEFFFGVKGIEDSWFSIVVELLDEITEIRDNTPVTGYVNERRPGESKIPLKHYKFKLPYQRDFSLHASIVIRTPGTSANIIANIGNEEAGMEPPTFEKCDFTNEEDPNYCFMANEGENYLYIEKKGVWDEDTVMFGVYSTGGNVTFEFTVRRGYYTVLPDDFSENIITLDPGEEMTFHTEVSDWSWYDYSNSPVMVALTLVNGKTELYLTSNETGSVNPTNAMWQSKFWPGNAIFVERTDPNFKNGIWSFTVKAIEESDFHINVIRFKSWFALNVPRIGLAPKNGLVMYNHLTWDTTKDYLLTIRVFTGSVEVYADYTWYNEAPSKEDAKWRSLDKGIGERSIILSKNDTDYDTLTIAVFGNEDIESVFEIMLSYLDEPKYLHSTVPIHGALKPLNYDYYQVLNPSGYSTKYRIEFESCDTQLPSMYLSTTTKKPGPDDYNFTAGPVIGHKMAIDALIEDSAFYVSVGGAEVDISYRLVAYSDKKYYPTPSAKEIFDDTYDSRKKQLTVFIKGASSPIVPVTDLTYEAYIRKIENPQPGSFIELNMETSCGIKKFANGTTIVPGQDGSEPIKIVLNDIDYYSVYAMNIIVHDTYGNADSYQPQWIISGKLHDFNGGVFPVILPAFPIPIGGYIILGLAILFTSYIMIGMCINYMNGARGVKVIPQSYFWINLPIYCWEGILFCLTCGRAKYSYYHDTSLNQDIHTGVDQDEEYSTAVGGYGAI
jgi:hypothetical protein